MPDDKVHGGHRNRLKDRFLSEGLDSFSEHNILELLLFYCIPQRDTNELAHSLLDSFGNLEGVFSASVDDLMKVEGAGGQTAYFLSLVSELMKQYSRDRAENADIEGINNVIEYAVRKLAVSELECLIICFVDNKSSLLSFHYIQEGFVSPEYLDTVSIIRRIMDTNATHAVVARNYLKKKADFYRDDREIMNVLSKALKTVGVTISDYIVVGRDHRYKTIKKDLR